MRKTFLAAVAVIACGAASTAGATGRVVDPAGVAEQPTWASVSAKASPRPADEAPGGASFAALASRTPTVPTVFYDAHWHDGSHVAPARLAVHTDNSTGVPEPPMLALWGAGIGAMLLLGRRRRTI
jgi:hypothetical protein